MMITPNHCGRSVRGQLRRRGQLVCFGNSRYHRWQIKELVHFVKSMVHSNSFFSEKGSHWGMQKLMTSAYASAIGESHDVLALLLFDVMERYGVVGLF